MNSADFKSKLNIVGQTIQKSQHYYVELLVSFCKTPIAISNSFLTQVGFLGQQGKKVFKSYCLPMLTLLTHDWKRLEKKNKSTALLSTASAKGGRQ